MKYKWAMQPVEDPEAVNTLRRALNNLPEPLARTLVIRGITTFEQAKNFFRPSLEQLHDPFLMKDMDLAVERILKAIRHSEKVLVFGDYDVDGTSATALMVSFLRDQGIETFYYIPDRYVDGYGLGTKGINYAIEKGISLIVSLDCGINAIDAGNYIKEKGLELIVCDHHTVGEALPNAVAVLDPKRPDCKYPFKELTGCGVGFKLVQGVLQALNKPKSEAFQFFDLVALSIASDIVPIIDENRVCMFEGLNQIKSNPRPGLKQMAIRSGMDLEECSTSRIVFGIGPRINAAGRMGDASFAVELMMAKNDESADDFASQLEYLNHKRRLLDKQTFDEALSLMDETFATCSQHAIVLHQPHWHLGVIGIVASRLVEKFNRPAILLGSVDGWAKGSARSIKGYNIYNAIKTCEDLLTKFGGHDHAAGVVLPEENVTVFREQLNEIVNDTLSRERLKPNINIDAPIVLNDINHRFWHLLQQFGPFGPENRTPVFLGKDLMIVGYPSLVGQGGHLKFKVQQGNSSYDAPVFDVIGFGLHDLFPVVRDSMMYRKPIKMLFSVEQNNFNGKPTLQLRARDLRAEA